MIPEPGVLRNLSKRPALLVLPALAAGILGTVVSAGGRESDDAFKLDQRLNPVQPGQLEATVVRAPNALPGSGGRPGRTAKCTSRGSGELRNPWVCVVRYPSGDVVRYRVTVNPSRSWMGVTPVLTIRGCCAGSPR